MSTGAFEFSYGRQTPGSRIKLIFTVAAGFALAIFVLLKLPAWCGCPMPPGKVTIVVTSRFNDDCEAQRAFLVMKRVYRDFEFDAQLSNEEPKCPAQDATIFLESTKVPGAAHSRLEDGCRYTALNPDHPNFTKRSLAHEFGHQRWGEVGMHLNPGIAMLLNMIYDCRNDAYIAMTVSSTPLDTARQMARHTMD